MALLYVYNYLIGINKYLFFVYYDVTLAFAKMMAFKYIEVNMGIGFIDKIKKKCYKKFDVDKEILESFCKYNETFWSQEEDIQGNGYIWIGLFMVEKWMSWMQAKFVFAKAQEEKYKLNTLVLDWEYNEELEKLYQSYGFEFVSLKIKMFQNPIGFIYGMLQAIWAFVTRGTGKRLVGLSYKGRQIGQYIYDTMIRTNKDIYTVNSTRNKLCFKKVMTSYWFLHTLDQIAKKYEPKIYLFDDLVYDEGMVVQMMHQKHAKLVKCGVGGVFHEVSWSDIPQFWPDVFRESVKKEIESLSEDEKKQYIEKANLDVVAQLQGKKGNVREAEFIFKNKQECTGEELKQIMGLDPNKKTVVIMAHCFSENPHKCSKQLYEDSYTWLVDTLKYVRNIDNVNWVLKGHPIAAVKYNETGVLEGIFEEYKNENLYWYPNEYNSNLLAQIADAIVTVYGTAGLEYPCLGIPVVHTGRASYEGFGCTRFVESIEAYYEQLKNMDKIERLSEQQMEMAKIVFVAYSGMRKRKFDALDDRMHQIDALFYKDLTQHVSYDVHNNMTLQEIMAYMKEHDIKETTYYQLGLEQ